MWHVPPEALTLVGAIELSLYGVKKAFSQALSPVKTLSYSVYTLCLLFFIYSRLCATSQVSNYRFVHLFLIFRGSYNLKLWIYLKISNFSIDLKKNIRFIICRSYPWSSILLIDLQIQACRRKLSRNNFPLVLLQEIAFTFANWGKIFSYWYFCARRLSHYLED